MYTKNNMSNTFNRGNQSRFSGRENFYTQRKQNRIFTQEEKEQIKLLNKEVKEILSKIFDAEKHFENKEPDFKNKYINKKIVLVTKYGKSVEGELVDIDKYRIHLKVDKKIKYYYKHSLLEYYSLNN